MKKPKVKIKAIVEFEGEYITTDKEILPSSIKQIEKDFRGALRIFDILPEYVHNIDDALYEKHRAKVKIVSFESKEE